MSKRNAVVLYDFNATKEGHLSIKAGELVATGKVAPGGWILATNVAAKSGYVPEKFLKFVDEEEQQPAAPVVTEAPPPLSVTTPVIATAPSLSFTSPAVTLSAAAPHSQSFTAASLSPLSPPPPSFTAASLSPPPPLVVVTSLPAYSTDGNTEPWNGQLVDYMHQVRMSSAQLWLHHENLSKLIAEAKVITQLLRDSLRIPNLRPLEKNTTSAVAAVAPELMRSVSALAKGVAGSREALRSSIATLDGKIQIFFDLANAAAEHRPAVEQPAAEQPAAVVTAAAVVDNDSEQQTKPSLLSDIASDKSSSSSSSSSVTQSAPTLIIPPAETTTTTTTSTRSRASSRSSKSGAKTARESKTERRKGTKSSRSSSDNKIDGKQRRKSLELPATSVPTAAAEPAPVAVAPTIVDTPPVVDDDTAADDAAALPPPPQRSPPAAPAVVVAAVDKAAADDEDDGDKKAEESSGRRRRAKDKSSRASSMSSESAAAAAEIARLQATVNDLKAQLSRQSEQLASAERAAEESAGDVQLLMEKVDGLKAELAVFQSAASRYSATHDRTQLEFDLIERQIYHSHIEFDGSGRLLAAASLVQQLDGWHCWENRRRCDARLLHKVRSSIRAVADKFQQHSRVIGHFLSFACSLLDVLQTHDQHRALLSGSSIRRDGICSAAVHEYKASGLFGLDATDGALSPSLLLSSSSSSELPGFEPVVRTFEMNLEQLAYQLFKALLAVYRKQLGALALRALSAGGIGATILFRELDRIYGELLENRTFEKVAEHVLLALVYFLNASWFNAFMSADPSTLLQPAVARTLKSLDAELHSWIAHHVPSITADRCAHVMRESLAAGDMLLAIESLCNSTDDDETDSGPDFAARYPFLTRWQIDHVVSRAAAGERCQALRQRCALSADEAERAVGIMISDELSFLSLMTADDVQRGRCLPVEALRIVDAYGNNRAVILPDGSVRDQQNYPLGVVQEDGNVTKIYSFDKAPIGSIDAGGIVADAEGECVGFVQVLQAGVVKNAAGSIVAEIDTSGQIKGNANTFCGEIRNFTLHLTNHFAAFSLFFDEDNMCAYGTA